MRDRVAAALGILVVSLAVTALGRTWTSKSGRQIEAELESAQGSSVVLVKPDGAKVTIARTMLSEEDQLFLDGAGEDGDTAAQVDEKAFMAIVKKRCVRCHKVCRSMDEILAKRWVRPGEPDKSPVYRIIGKHRKPNGKYHNVSEEDKKALHSFISTYKPPSTPAK